MTIFELINKLFFRKKESFEDLDHESLQSFQPFMINRWLSFYGKAQAVFVNETLNKFTGVFDDKNNSYKLYYHLIPHLKYSKISYIKKKKEETTVNSSVGIYASYNNISKREVLAYLDLQNNLSK
jgi:hypothetical protein